MIKCFSASLLIAAAIGTYSLPATAAPMFATSVVAENSTGLTASGGAIGANRLIGAAALGGPSASTPGSLGFYSLGFGGSLTLGFSGLFGAGNATFFEATGGAFYPREAADIFVFDIAAMDFVLAGTVDNQPAGSNDSLSFAGLCVAGCNAIRFVDRSLPADFAAIPEADGYDVNAVSVTPFQAPVTDVPEPGTLALLGVAFAGLGLARRRRQA